MYPIVGLRGGARIVADFNVRRSFATPINSYQEAFNWSLGPD
jgi:hypothetical protein